MFTRQQIISTALGFLPMAPSYLASHYDDVTAGFAVGLCVCAVFFGQGGFFGLLIWAVLWWFIAQFAASTAQRIVDAAAGRKPAAPANRPAAPTSSRRPAKPSSQQGALPETPTEKVDHLD